MLSCFGGFKEMQMPRRTVDPGALSGEALERWYRRSPLDMERERRANEAEAWDEFTTKTRRDLQAQAEAAGSEDLWIASGAGGWRPVHARRDLTRDDIDQEMLAADASEMQDYDAFDIGNPANPRLRREYIREKGFWPYTKDGRPYDVGHIKAIADGGTNTLDNIQPIHPEEHRAAHMRDGDFARWSRRAGIARAFGGRVARGLGILSFVPTNYGDAVRADPYGQFRQFRQRLHRAAQPGGPLEAA